MNNIHKKLLETYRIIYNERNRTYELHKAWSEDEEVETIVLYKITERSLIATLLDLKKEDEGK